MYVPHQSGVSQEKEEEGVQSENGETTNEDEDLCTEDGVKQKMDSENVGPVTVNESTIVAS